MEEPKKSKKRTGLFVVLGVLGVLLLGGGIGLGFWLSRPDTAQLGTDLESRKAKVVSEVSKMYLVPTNESPQVAIIQNRTSLKESFFQDSQDGDFVLVYEKAHIGIIYRQSIHKIIKIGSATSSPNTTAQSPAGTSGSN